MQVMSECFMCKHALKRRDKFKPFDVCDAFPNGIPEEIFSGKVLHHSPYPNDKGIQYEEFIDHT